MYRTFVNTEKSKNTPLTFFWKPDSSWTLNPNYNNIWESCVLKTVLIHSFSYLFFSLSLQQYFSKVNKYYLFWYFSAFLAPLQDYTANVTLSVYSFQSVLFNHVCTVYSVRCIALYVQCLSDICVRMSVQCPMYNYVCT